MYCFNKTEEKMLKNILISAFAAAMLMASHVSAVAGELIYTPCKTRSDLLVPNDTDLSDILDSADLAGLDAGKIYPWPGIHSDLPRQRSAR